MFPHAVRVTLGEGAEAGSGLEGDQVKTFDFASDMLELADDFAMTAQLTREVWDMATPDAVVRVFVDDSQVFEGYIDDREKVTTKGAGSELSIFGRDKGGRLVDESAPLIKFGGLGLDELVKQLVSPWFPSVSLSNARNRSLVRGRGRRLAKTSGEPLITDHFSEKTGKALKLVRKVEPGETTATVIGYFLERARLLGWSSADGREFIVGTPNYSQAPQFFFFQGAEGSARWQETNVERSTYTESVAQRYSQIQAVGLTRGDSENYGPNVTRRTATALAKGRAPGFAGLNGTGGTSVFKHRKRLIVSDDDVTSAAAAQSRADREMAIRDAGGTMLVLEVAGFGQALGGDVETRPALFACDTMARWEDEQIGLRGDYLITKVRFSRTREDGDRSELTLVPRGTELVSR